MLTLVRRSLGRVPVVFGSVIVLLAVFQIALIAVARSFVLSGNFAWITQMAPPSFIRNTFGAAFTSFGGMAVIGFFEPLIIIMVVQFAIYLATEPAGEIESGLLDLILARPVMRRTLITRSLVVMTLGVLAATMTMGVATWAGLMALAPEGAEWPAMATVRLLMIHFAALAWCFGGAGLGCAAFVNRRTAASATIGLSAIALYLAEFVGASWPAVKYLSTISPFHYFKGPEILEGVAHTARNLTVLLGIGVTGIVIAYAQFARRDIR